MPIQFTDPYWLLILPPLLVYFYWQHRRTITDMSPARKRIALVLRCLLAALLVLVVAGFRWVKRGDALAVVFLVDGSRSVRDDQLPRIESYIGTAQRKMRTGDRAGLITFAQEPHLQSPLGPLVDAARLRDPGATTATDIAQALRMARNELDTSGRDYGKRIVLLSDGNENVRKPGGALAEAPSLSADHILLDTWTLPVDLKREALVDKVVIPTRVKIGEPFQVRVVVTSTIAQSGTVALTRDGKPIGESRQVSLHAGKNVVVFDQTIDSKGFFRYGVTLDAPQDTIPENNRGEGFVWVLGRPTVLYVADSPALTGFLRKTLQSENIDVEYAPPEAMPTTAAALQRFDSVFLSNVPASALSLSQMTALQIACRDFGIGFGMVGGVNSYGAGYYRGTPIEATLPVSMDVKEQKRLPSVAVALVIEDLEIQTTINMSIEAAKSTMDLLEPIDQVGVLDCQGYGYGGGDPTAVSAAGTWRIPMQHVTDREALKSAMQNLTDMGDPPVYDPFLVEAGRVLNNTDAKVKHMIFLGDGDAVYEQDQKTIINNIKRINAQGITLSTIATGADLAGKKFMAALAAIGGGQSYVADQPQDLPRLLLKDQETISQPPIIEEPFRAAPVDGDEILKGIDWNTAPPLLGYDVVSLKPTASLALIDPSQNRNDPIFAGWRYGLGRSIAFMSDDRAKWAAQWLGWPGYAKFWAQAIRWTLRPYGPSDYDTQVTLDGGQGHIEVNAVDPQGRYVNQLQIRGLIAPPNANAIQAKKPTVEPLRQTGPGRYEAWFDAPEIGTYLVNVLQKDPSGAAEHSTPVGLSTAYSPEYKDTQSNRFLMTQLAHVGGGRADPAPDAIYSEERPDAISPVDTTWFWYWHGLWMPGLLVLALALLPFDIAVRRLAVDREDFRRARAWLRGRLVTSQGGRDTTAELGRLKEVKEGALAGRAIANADRNLGDGAATELGVGGEPGEPILGDGRPRPSLEVQSDTVERVPIAAPARPLSRTLRPEGRDTQAESVETPPVAAESPATTPPESEDAGMSRLMAAKRRAQERQEKRDA